MTARRELWIELRTAGASAASSRVGLISAHSHTITVPIYIPPQNMKQLNPIWLYDVNDWVTPEELEDSKRGVKQALRRLKRPIRKCFGNRNVDWVIM